MDRVCGYPSGIGHRPVEPDRQLLLGEELVVFARRTQAFGLHQVILYLENISWVGVAPNSNN